MDQPDNSHYSMHIGQQTITGRGGYYGRAGYDGNDHSGDGYEVTGYSGGQPGNGNYGNLGQGADFQAGASVPEPRGAADALALGSGAAQDSRPPAAPPQAANRQATRRRGGTKGDGNTPPDSGSPGRGDEPARHDTDGPATDGPATDDTVTEGQVTDDEGASDQGTDDQAPGSNGNGAPGNGAAASSAAGRMRDLLARSSADHAASERATAIALDEIRERLAGLEQMVAEIREDAASGQDVIADRVAEHLAPPTQRLAGMSATLDGLTAGLSTFSAQLSAVDGRLANVDSRFAGADVKLASTEGRIIALDTRFERLDERLDDQYDRVTSIDTRLAATDSRVAMIGGQFAEAIAPLAEEMRARPTRGEVEETVRKWVEAAYSDLATRLSSLEDTILTLAEALLRPGPGHTPQGGLRPPSTPQPLHQFPP